MVDVEKQITLHKKNIPLAHDCKESIVDKSHFKFNNSFRFIVAKWIDWRMDGELLACACTGDIKIYDKRTSKIEKVLEKIHNFGGK